MRRAALGLYTYAEFFAQVGFFLPVMAASYAKHRGDPTQREPGRWMRRFGRSTSRATPIWKFSVEGEPPADIHGRGYVVVANHESTADPFLLAHLPWDMRWVAKEEIFKLPVLGWMMTFGGDIPLRRGDSASIHRMMAEARRTLAAGMSIMMFPEGTRSSDGSLGAFKDGAFQLALEAKVPVLPLALAGTRACRPKGSLWFGEARAAVRVLPPIDTAGMTEGDLPRLREAARGAIAAALPDLRRATTSVESASAAPGALALGGSR
ncbi:MAG: 1-acyl-sn-glycerol-3-phosphate acyltransferase [Myxococcales bacterium]|jgi:1-acyl-sn-glycerol-3-phosphate acyltransferase|nr:1-acyl-sn-glycerol-3-phosphate acyltransferase [Myxococcales bacterium]